MAATGLMRFAINAGFVAGPAAAGILADRSFFLLFAGDALTSLVLGAMALLWLPRGAPRRESPVVRGEGIRAVFNDRPFLVFLSASVVIAAVYSQTSATFPLWVHDNGFNNTTYGALVGINGTVIVVVELFLLVYLQRFSTRPVMVLGFLLVGLGFAATALSHSLLLIAITVLIWTAGEMLAFPTATVHVANASPEHLRGRLPGRMGACHGRSAGRSDPASGRGSTSATRRFCGWDADSSQSSPRSSWGSSRTARQPSLKRHRPQPVGPRSWPGPRERG